MKNKLAPLAIALAAAIVGTFVMLKTPAADALHWGGLRTESDTVYWCYEQSLPSDWKNGYVFAAARWNSGASDWTLVHNNCANMVTGRWDFDSVEWPNDPGRFEWWLNGAGNIIGGLAYLNTDMNWSLTMSEGASMGSVNNKCNPSCDVMTIMVHEMGHWVRLVHGYCSTSVMCVDWKVRRFPSSHDHETVVNIYGQ